MHACMHACSAARHDTARGVLLLSGTKSSSQSTGARHSCTKHPELCRDDVYKS
jgi:hypothetical protein